MRISTSDLRHLFLYPAGHIYTHINNSRFPTPMQSKVEDELSPRSTAPSSSVLPIASATTAGSVPRLVIPPIVGIPSCTDNSARSDDSKTSLDSLSPRLSPLACSSHHHLSDKEYYRRLYRSASQDWGTEPATALVTLARRMQSDPQLDHHKDAWDALNQACDEQLFAKDEQARFDELRRNCYEKKLELALLQAELKDQRKKQQRRKKRSRTISLSPRAFAQSLFMTPIRTRSASSNGPPLPSSPEDSTSQTQPHRSPLFRSKSSGGLPRLPRVSRSPRSPRGPPSKLIIKRGPSPRPPSEATRSRIHN